MLESREKVVCYIVRDQQLLVFRHLDEPWDESGLQVPAGSVRSGEDPHTAALREGQEETGLPGLRIVRKVGEADYDMRPYRAERHHRHFFLMDLDGEAPSRWVGQESDPSDGTGPKRFECYWIPTTQGHVLAGGQGALLGLL